MPPRSGVIGGAGTAERSVRVVAGGGGVNDDDDDDDDDTLCVVCGDGGEAAGNQILICDGVGCDQPYHMRCLRPPLLSVPVGDWYCPRCTSAGVAGDGAKPKSGGGAAKQTAPRREVAEGKVRVQLPQRERAREGEDDASPPVQPRWQQLCRCCLTLHEAYSKV